MTLAKYLDITSIIDKRGHIGVLEANRHFPFDIKRIYYLKALSSENARGFHAHKELFQAAICLSGSFKMLLDDGENRENVLLNSSEPPLLIEPLVWHVMSEFSEDCIILVLASDYYCEEDYLRDYADFLRFRNERLQNT
jgi:hypothetical protein